MPTQSWLAHAIVEIKKMLPVAVILVLLGAVFYGDVTDVVEVLRFSGYTEAAFVIRQSGAMSASWSDVSGHGI